MIGSNRRVTSCFRFGDDVDSLVTSAEETESLLTTQNDIFLKRERCIDLSCLVSVKNIVKNTSSASSRPAQLKPFLNEGEFSLAGVPVRRRETRIQKKLTTDGARVWK